MKKIKQETGERQEQNIDQILDQQKLHSEMYNGILSNKEQSGSMLNEPSKVIIDENKKKKAIDYPKEHIRQVSRQSSTWSEYRNAFSLVRVIASQWSWGEITLGLEYYARNQAQKKRDFKKFIQESNTTYIDPNDLSTWQRYAQLSFHAFKVPLTELQEQFQIHNVVAFDKTQQTMRPAYFICVDELTKSVLVIFRGTKSFSDLITDLHCSSIRHNHGYCHKGILIASQWFNNNRFIKQILHRTLEMYPQYELRLLGHSLGGGTAAILASFWHQNEFPHVRAYSYACPPVLSHFLADECGEYVTSFINGDDVVTRLSMTAIEELRRDVSHYPWREEMMRDIQNSSIVKFATNVKSYASGLLSRSMGFLKNNYYNQQGMVNTLEDMDPVVVASVIPQPHVTIVPVDQPIVKEAGEYADVYPGLPLGEYEELSETQNRSRSDSVDSDFGDLSLSGGVTTPTNSNTSKKKGKIRKDVSDQNRAHFIINDYENLVVSLYPAGKIFQIRNIEGKVYLKRAKQEEYTKIILSETWKEDHRMLHYKDNLLNYQINVQPM
ncbi:hypothetical protein AKO1_011282 [Acrasis kona]|uniref:Fungal lipase-type domain-containing protein n=1 Tax=Acrasis kona TaxID=1008807 RepID=A0AAW2YVP0_9EUKA